MKYSTKDGKWFSPQDIDSFTFDAMENAGDAVKSIMHDRRVLKSVVENKEQYAGLKKQVEPAMRMIAPDRMMIVMYLAIRSAFLEPEYNKFIPLTERERDAYNILCKCYREMNKFPSSIIV